MLSQHQAVVSVTKAHFGENFKSGQDVKSYATKADKQAIAAKVAAMMLSGEVQLSESAFAKYATSVETLTSKYVMGMVTNWFNKSKELNGGIQYETKNPGSRAGAKDPVLRELKLLRKHLETTDNVDGLAKVDAAIADRLAASAPSLPSVNEELIPDHLKDLIG